MFHVLREITFEQCLASAPQPYKLVMNTIHLISVPLYIFYFYILIFKTSESLRKYRRYLVWHIFVNFCFETFICQFMLPVPYLPTMVFRSAGYLKYFNISGLLQFYILVFLTIQTGLSISELFKYRFKAALVSETFRNSNLYWQFIFYYISNFLTVGWCFSTVSSGINRQKEHKESIYMKNPTISTEILCHTSVVAPPLWDPIFTPMLGIMFIVIAMACSLVLQSMINIWKKLDSLSNHMSKVTINRQKMLLKSLFIQTSIHAIMLAIPIFGFLYSSFYKLHFNATGYIFLILASFHGLFSTNAMIFFTKPLRIKIIETFFNFFPFSSSKTDDIGIVVFPKNSNNNNLKQFKSSVFN